MTQRHVWLAGATGVTGGYLLTALLAAPTIVGITTPGRRAPANGDARVTTIGFEALDQAPAPDAAFCCLGTTRKRAGSRAAFWAVDHDLVLSFAKAARGKSCQRFYLMSSVGADARASSLYLGTKGRVEAALAKLGFSYLQIFRPSFLKSARTETRPIETVVGAIAPYIDPLLVGGLRRYRSIGAETVAAAMAAAARGPERGKVVLHYDDIVALATS
jgi:uncharacterized protein YbjT (DUF2867 family)